jgi:small subunit ribosomal protein S4
VHRLGFAPSRRAARQFVLHGHVRVNGHKADIASMILKAGTVVEVGAKAPSREYAKPFMENAIARGIAPWLSLNKDEFRGEVLHVPTRDEIAPIVNEQRVVELYSK